MNIQELSTIFKALSDPNRLTVFLALLSKDELCVCEMTDLLEIATATVSRHMALLQNAGLVTSRKEGRWVYYRLDDQVTSDKGVMRLLSQWIEESVDGTILDQLSKQQKVC